MDSGLSHEALDRFAAIEARLDKLEGKDSETEQEDDNLEDAAAEDESEEVHF